MSKCEAEMQCIGVRVTESALVIVYSEGVRVTESALTVAEVA